LKPIFTVTWNSLHLVFRDAAALFNDLKPLHMTDGICSLGDRSFTASAKLTGEVPTT
jgi:hypothetical protein